MQQILPHSLQTEEPHWHNDFLLFKPPSLWFFVIEASKWIYYSEMWHDKRLRRLSIAECLVLFMGENNSFLKWIYHYLKILMLSAMIYLNTFWNYVLNYWPSTSLLCLDFSCDFGFHDFFGSSALAELMTLLIERKATYWKFLALYSNPNNLRTFRTRKSITCNPHFIYKFRK